MDGLSLIVGALGGALAELAQPVVQQAYLDFKKLIIDRLGSKSEDADVEGVLDAYEKNPERYQKALETTLKQVEADADFQVMNAAENLTQMLQTQSATYTAGRDMDNRTINMGENARYSEGDMVESVGGDFVKGDKFSGDKVAGDKIAGDKVEGNQVKGGEGSTNIQQNIGNVSGGNVKVIGKQTNNPKQ